jgi:hypothetical protein
MRIATLRRVLPLLLLFAWLPAARASTHTELRGWGYLNYTLASKSGWGFTFMPGVRYELADSEGEAGGVAMHELFTGPFYKHEWDKLSLTVPLWFYYMGFPVGDDTFLSYNVELIPILRYQANDVLALQSRTILHNKIHASNPVFTEDSQRWGHSLLLREMLTLELAPPALKGWSLLLSEEVFVGLLEDAETAGIAKGEPFFEKRGLSMNRVYLGAKRGWKLDGAPLSIVVNPQYVLESHHDPSDGAALTRLRHYAFLSVTLVHLLGR